MYNKNLTIHTNNLDKAITHACKNKDEGEIKWFYNNGTEYKPVSKEKAKELLADCSLIYLISSKAIGRRPAARDHHRPLGVVL